MSSAPIITFKAGACDFDTSQTPPIVKPRQTPGYLYLFEEDDLIHFCWRPRSVSYTQPELDLTMFPTDGRFTPFEPDQSSSSRPSINGRIFVLRFQSSTQLHFFWLQSKSQHASGDPAWFSPRDLKLGQIVDRLLQGDQVNVEDEVASISKNQGGGKSDDDNNATSQMEDVRTENQASTPGNAPDQNPSEGQPGREGQSSDGREGGGQAKATPSDITAAAVQSFLRSMQGNRESDNQGMQHTSDEFIMLTDLLLPSSTISIIDQTDKQTLHTLLSHLPPSLLFLQQETFEHPSLNPSPDASRAALEALTLDQKRDILKKVLRSPQFSQSLVSLTQALQDGGLPGISDALRLPVENGGYVGNPKTPMVGGDAIKAFLDGFKREVEDKPREDDRDSK